MVTPSREFWGGKRVLLTGHTGFKGSWCALWLQQLGADVHGFALPPDSGAVLWETFGKPCSSDDFGDIRDLAAVHAAFKRIQPEIVLHMAAQALVRPSYDNPELTFDTNVMGVVRVLDAARVTPSVRAVVNITSDKCYENIEQLWAYRESEPMGGADPYSASKGCAELVTASYRRSFFAQPGGPYLASGRAGNVIGGGDWSADRLIPDCIRSFRRGEPALIRNPLATRPWQHVLEPISGYLILAEALYSRGAEVAEGWNFGPDDKDAWSVERIVDHMVCTWGRTASWQQDEAAHPHEAMLLRVDATKARLRLGWRPRLDVSEALRWSIEWYDGVDKGTSGLAIGLRQIERFSALPG